VPTISSQFFLVKREKIKTEEFFKGNCRAISNSSYRQDKYLDRQVISTILKEGSEFEVYAYSYFLQTTRMFLSGRIGKLETAVERIISHHICSVYSAVFFE
jgi:hypothetical protein